MDGVTLQGRIYEGYAKAAAKVGLTYAHYRAASTIDMLNVANKLADIPVAFSTLVRPWLSTPKWTDETMLAWADGRLLQVNDLLVGPNGTFYIASMPSQLPIQAVRCTHVAATIKRTGYSTSGPMVPALTTVASNLPIHLKLKSVNVKPEPGLTALTSGVGISTWLAFIPLQNGVLQRNDVLTDDEGTAYTIDAPDWTPMGYVAQVRLANP